MSLQPPCTSWGEGRARAARARTAAVSAVSVGWLACVSTACPVLPRTRVRQCCCLGVTAHVPLLTVRPAVHPHPAPLSRSRLALGVKLTLDQVLGFALWHAALAGIHEPHRQACMSLVRRPPPPAADAKGSKGGRAKAR